MRRLRGEPHRQAAVLPNDGGRRARLERARRKPLADDPPGGDHVAVVEQRVVRPLHDSPEADVRPDLGKEDDLVRERVERVDDDGKNLVVDDNEFGGVDALGMALGDDDHDDLADEPHPLARNERPGHP